MAKRRKKNRIGCLPRLIGLFALGAGLLLGYGYMSNQSPTEVDQKAWSQARGWVGVLTNQGLVPTGLTNEHEGKEVAYRFAVLSDSHEDTTVFPQIVNEMASRDDLSFVAHLGDLSNAGEIEKLREAKLYLDNIAAPVHVLPGDHDRNWLPERDLRNFKQVFGLTATSYSFSKGDELFVFIDNSDSQNGLTAENWDWLEKLMAESQSKSAYFFMSTPLDNPYLSFKAMGSQNPDVKAQGDRLAKLLGDSNVSAVFAGDTHSFAKFRDEANGFDVVTVGAAGVSKNLLPLYVVVEIFTDGSYNAQSVPYQSRE